jgi:hypothetical protein
MDDGFEMQLLGGEQWKALAQIKPHLVAEHGQRACARTVLLAHAVPRDMRHKIEILLHGQENTAILSQGESPCERS